MTELNGITRLTRDLRKVIVSEELGIDEARYLVDAYYTMQGYRVASGNQVKALEKSGEPHSVLVWYAEQADGMEGQIRRALDAWTDTKELGRWAKSITGIGPVIAAGLLANIDIRKCPAAGHVWAFAGLDPTKRWEKGQKRPWNASLKRLCWLLGESFVKVSGLESDVYGKIYRQRKEYERAKNERGEYAEYAALQLERKKFGRDTIARAAYEQGRLPDGHLHSRAKRYAVKLFLSHYWEKGREIEGLPIPKPYPIQFLGHAHQIERPQ